MAHKNQAFWETLGRVYGGRCIDEIKRNVFEFVWKEMEKSGEKNPPILNNLLESKFISARKAKIVYSKYLEKLEAYLLPNKENFTIVVSESLKNNPLRLRTTIAHELGHTFFYDINSCPIKCYFPNINTPFRKERGVEGRERYVWEDWEGFAFEIGRNILIPYPLLVRNLSSETSVSSFLKLKNTFKVTSSILARRLVHDGFWDVYIFLTLLEKNGKSVNVLFPKPKNCFKSKRTFKTLTINSFWKEIEKLILNNLNEDFAEARFKLNKKEYKCEVKFLNNFIIGMLKLENK